MKQIGKVVETARQAITQKSVKPCKDKSPTEDKLIVRLFAVLAVKYSQRWTSQFTDENMLEAYKREWARELGSYTKDEIAYAVDNCIDEFPDWPPTIGQFKKLCQSALIEPVYRLPRLDNPTKPETALKALAEIKRLLS